MINDDFKYLAQAIDLSRQCVACSGSYRVGAVIVTLSGEIYTGYTHQNSPSNHAEEEAIAAAKTAGAELRGATIYSSMEPCSIRKSKPHSCTQLILDNELGRVVFALYEPLCFVQCEGAAILRQAGVEVVVIDELSHAVRDVNAHLF